MVISFSFHLVVPVQDSTKSHSRRWDFGGILVNNQCESVLTFRIPDAMIRFVCKAGLVYDIVEVTTMHILILAPTPDDAQGVQAVIADPANRYSVASTWLDILSTLRDDPPDVILIERAALARLESTILLNLAEPGHWPPLVLVDTPAAGLEDGLSIASWFPHVSPPSFRIGELCIDTRRKRAGLGEHWVTLPPIQYRLLLALARRAGEVVTYQELLREVWGYETEGNEARELLKEHIRRIRRRLRMDPERQRYIRAVRGFGYMLTSPEEE
jgi:DNA-binding winged helix-turn-helix (wHTH) protein